jgi:hypothetical protein
MVKDMVEYRISMSTTKNNDSVNAMGFVSSLPPTPNQQISFRSLKLTAKQRLLLCSLYRRGHAVVLLVEALRYKDTGSIPNGVIGFFH